LGDALARLDNKRIRKRAATALQTLQHWNHVYQDVYDYLMPYRQGALNRQPGPPSLNKIFDSTPLRGAPRYAGRAQQFLMPPGEAFFQLEAGPMLAAQGQAEVKSLNEELERYAMIQHGALNNSSFHVSTNEMFLDQFVGTGAMLMLEGDDYNPIRTVAVPKCEVALERGPYGDITGRHWARSFRAYEIAEMWPKGRFSEELRRIIKDEEDKPVTICQSTVWHQDERRWRLYVFRLQNRDGQAGGGGRGDDEDLIFDETYRASPWITPRMFVCAGEAEGFGAGLLSLPGTKTLNKVREYDLKAAAIALFGIWAYQDGSGFNPKTAKFAPGAFWPVRSNATSGAFGPSVQKLNIPGDYDLSRIITEDEREQIRQAQMDRTMPPAAGSVRSPTEILERLKDGGEEMVGLLARQQLEIVTPVVQRANEILANRKILPTDRLNIDQLAVGLRVVSPIVQAAMAKDAKAVVDFAQVVAGLWPDKMSLALRDDDVLTELAKWMGVKERHIPSQAERDQVRQQEAQREQAAMAIEAAKAAPQQQPPQAQDIVNGAVN